ncbi:MAG: hypothetical protein KatS3mg105_0590 [Gemmatales bacterium]|nr:MAG: hypothetical protein KatS3mg105_0590 [Gemmatales bacterium]
MQHERWKIVTRLLEQVKGTTGRLVMAVAPRPLEVVLYETPVLAKGQPPHNPLRGFVQEAVSLLEQPTAAEIAALLHLPTAVVELVLGNLRQMGGAESGMAGRWSVPQSAPQFGTGGSEPMIWRRTRRLLCYWPQRQVLLPVLPRMRLRDLVELGVHKLQGEVADWYDQIASWPDAEGLKRGRPDTVRILPLDVAETTPGSGHSATCAAPDAPVPVDEVLVTKCRLDVIALMWASFRSGVWEVVSRLWSRPTPSDESEGISFAPGEPLLGLSLPEQLLGGKLTLDDLGKLFSPDQQAWRMLLCNRDRTSPLHRDLDGNSRALIIAQQTDAASSRRWKLLPTSLARDARLICWTGI